MRRVRASIKVGRREKEIKEQRPPRGRGPARSRAEAGASVPRTGEPRHGDAGAAPTFRGGKGLAGSWSRTQEGEDLLGLPGTLTATAPRESAPSSLRAAARTAGPGGTRRDPERLGGARAAAPRRGLHRPESANPTSQTGSTGRRDTAQDPASPGTGRGREGPGQRGRSCPS